MKILLLGKNGQVATDLATILQKDPNIQVQSFGQNEIDFTITDDFRQYLSKYKGFDILINCTSYNHVDKAEEDKNSAFKLNKDAVKEMAKHCQRNNMLFIHFSTNYVFDGKNLNPNKESDINLIKPLGIYGSSKLEGEMEVKNSGCKYLVFRLSTVFRENRNNFVTKMLQLFKEHESLDIVSDQISNPTYSYDAANAVYQIINLIILDKIDSDKFNKIYHLANEGSVSFHEFCNFIFQESIKCKKFSIKTKKVCAIKSSQFKTAVERPINGSFDLSLFKKSFHLNTPTWQDATKRMLDKY